MELKYLKAENYRNIISADISFKDGVNLLYGHNGAGKTNALEAVYLFAICKSFRTNKDSDFITHGKNEASLKLCFTSDFSKENEKPFEMQLSFFKDAKKRMLYEGVPITKVSEFAGRFRAVFFTPDHLSLVKGSPDERRKFADMALSQIKPSYIRCLNEYSRLLSQRNSLLKNAKLSGKCDEDLLFVYSEALSETASLITRQRAYFSEYLEKEAAGFYESISGRNEKLFIKYLSSEKEDPKNTEKTKQKYLKLYTENIDSEIKYGATKYGPHKDDILFFIGSETENRKVDELEMREPDDENEENIKTVEFAARTFASQGQQRSAVLSLKLAEGEIIKNLSGEYPVYLFDDVLSELDNNRKKQLLSLFEDKQVMITCCDENSFDSSLVNNKIKVENGKYSAI
jgi:DNA replication and repair protein RecF